MTTVSLWISVWKLGISRFFSTEDQKLIHFFSEKENEGKKTLKQKNTHLVNENRI